LALRLPGSVSSACAGLRQVGAVEPEDLGSPGGERPCRHGAGDDAGEVQHPQACGASPRRRDAARTGADARLQDGQRRDGLTLRMGPPRLMTSYGGSERTGGRECVLQGLARPVPYGGLDVSRTSCATEHVQRPLPVPRVVRVQPQPTVCRAEEPRQRREQVSLDGFSGPRVALAAGRHGNVLHVDDDGGPRGRAPTGVQDRRRQRRHGDRRGHGRQRRQRRGQEPLGLPDDVNQVQQVWVATEPCPRLAHQQARQLLVVHARQPTDPAIASRCQ
jgi:hypothetical protein